MALGFAIRHGQLVLAQWLAADFENTWNMVRPAQLTMTAVAFLGSAAASAYFLMRGKFEDSRLLVVAVGALAMMAIPLFNGLRSIETGAQDSLAMVATIRSQGDASSREQEVLKAIALEEAQALNEFRWARRGEQLSRIITLIEQSGLSGETYKKAGFMTYSDLASARERAREHGASLDTLDQLNSFTKRAQPLDLSP